MQRDNEPYHIDRITRDGHFEVLSKGTFGGRWEVLKS